MRMRLKRYAALLLAAAMALPLMSGCFNTSMDELYALPRLSDEYVQLQREIDAILSSGAEYSAPTSGSYRQAVQFEDIDSDGEKEALVFYAVPGDDMPLKVAIFENDGETYTRAAGIEGSGSDIKSIEYLDMDGDGMYEIIMGWQIASGVSMLAGYSLVDYQVVQLFSCSYTAYISCFKGEHGASVAAVGPSASENQSEATVYSLIDGDIEVGTARLSAGAGAVSNIKYSPLSDGVNGLFIECAIDESSLVTDILAYERGALSNVSLRSASGVSQGTVRTYGILSADIDTDGVIEVPNPVKLPSQPEVGNYWLIEWYAFDSTGSRTLKKTTYHNYSDGWYLELPKGWSDNISVRRDASVSGERTMIFSYRNGDAREIDFLAIYALSGDNRTERSMLSGRKALAERNNVIFAQEILGGAKKLPISVNEEEITGGFHIIFSDVNT